MKQLINFKKETLAVISQNNHYPLEVEFVTDGRTSISFDEFLRLSDFEYDNGFGGNHIGLGVKIVGKDWWLERHEYDGSEWWEYKTLPQRPLNPKNKAFCLFEDEWD